MRQCVNTKVGEMLHAYELKMLSESDTDMFERHLLECCACAEEFKRTAAVATFLTSDAEIKETTEQCTEEGDGFESKWRRLFWPSQSFVLFRPALLILLLALLVYPAYRGLQIDTDDRPVIVPIQRNISLIQTRSGKDSPDVRIDERTALTVKFQGVNRSDAYRVEIIRAVDQSSVYPNSETRFDESMTATLIIEPHALEVGEYLVRLRSIDGSGDWQDLAFRAVK